MQDFSTRKGITFPLLGDPQSRIITSFGVLNPKADGFSKGMAFPGYFLIGTDGKVKDKYFRADYVDRDTGGAMLLKLFPELAEGEGKAIEGPHLKLTLGQTDTAVIAGTHFTLYADVELPAGSHVYAPGVKGYKPIALQLEAPAGLKLEGATRYPDAKTLFLPVIKETVPVFEGKFRILQDVAVNGDRAFMASVGSGKTLTLTGTLQYQVCDKTQCYFPEKVAVSWDAQVQPLDRQRAAEAIQHK